MKVDLRPTPRVPPRLRTAPPRRPRPPVESRVRRLGRRRAAGRRRVAVAILAVQVVVLVVGATLWAFGIVRTEHANARIERGAPVHATPGIGSSSGTGTEPEASAAV